MKTVAQIEYADYQKVIASLAHPEHQVAFSLPPALVKFTAGIKGILNTLVAQTKLGFTELLRAFASRDAYAFFKAIKFNLDLLLKGLHAVTSLVPQGLKAFFKWLHDTGALAKLRDGAMSVDDFLKEHPILRKLAGPALAGLLLWMWINTAFVGDPWYDFDMSAIGAALFGHYSIYDLFASPEGLTGLAIFATAMLVPGGVGVAWLGDTVANLIAGVAMTLARTVAPKVFSAIHKLISKHPVLKETAMTTAQRSTTKEAAAPLPAEAYDYFLFQGRKAYTLETSRGSLTLQPRAIYGVRPSTNGKFIRLIMLSAPNKVYTISYDEGAYLAKNSIAKSATGSNPVVPKATPINTIMKPGLYRLGAEAAMALTGARVPSPLTVEALAASKYTSSLVADTVGSTDPFCAIVSNSGAFLFRGAVVKTIKLASRADLTNLQVMQVLGELIANGGEELELDLGASRASGCMVWSNPQSGSYLVCNAP